MKPCSPRVVEDVRALYPKGIFLTVQGGRLLLINSFARKIQVKFFGIMWALRQPSSPTTILFPRPTPVSRSGRSKGSGDLPILHFRSRDGWRL